jgi:hypothetical protein
MRKTSQARRRTTESRMRKAGRARRRRTCEARERRRAKRKRGTWGDCCEAEHGARGQGHQCSQKYHLPDRSGTMLLHKDSMLHRIGDGFARSCTHKSGSRSIRAVDVGLSPNSGTKADIQRLRLMAQVV